ncbi:hypothetical protein CLPUN_27450 [Clostridium puniceum]|uniref:DUF3006 domain-containing protein n=1 Tax=Clostridium puniceum TaxID=29367 RepID=A0A1S8TF50_9CLOT|nr:DUF3006 domain-containing protein [Clostridium puniceum]OOM76358.1 hypothetical protein CLPUN_27450 [Clostridium puniceum]
MNKKYIVDRIEEKYAVVEMENGDMHRISTDNIRGDFKEGDILINKGEYFEIDKAFTFNRRKQIENLMKDMWKE